MPHGLFTRHSKPRFLAIHQDLLEICDGQHCEAALLTEIEFICSTFLRSEDTPIFRISLAELETRILHLYKVDRIRTGMKWLTDRGFLKVTAKPSSQGGATLWGLEVETVNKALAHEPLSPPLEKPRGTPGKTKGSLKEEEVDSLQMKGSPPTPPTEEPQIPTPEDAGLNAIKSLKVNVQRIAKHLNFPINTAQMQRQLPVLNRRYRKAHEEGEAEEYLAAILKACSEFHEGSMQGIILVYCEQQTRDRWRVTPRYGSSYNGTQTAQDPKQSCSAFALKLADILEAAGRPKAEAYRAASSMPDWKMSQIEATAVGIKDFALRVGELLRGKDISAGGALEMIYRKFGNVQTPKMSSIEQVIASYGDDEEE